jgi:DNA polymerase-3 subunit epsilon
MPSLAGASIQPPPLSRQRSFEDLGIPLRDVTFCVIDLETTGVSPADCAITEIGAVRLRGGECLGTFQTLINPGRAIPTVITVLTGITEAMVMPAPPIESVIPSLLEFIGDSVIVGHNIRFDVSFIDAALRATERPRLTNVVVDTRALAHRLVRDEVPDCRLGTLASRFRLDHRPTHRALDDALATGDLLHALLERAAAFGVLGLDDLVALPRIGGHPQAGKLRLTEPLPRKPGVYLFRDAQQRVLYVGKATNLRSRVRSYFSGDDRRKIGSLLRETQAIDHVVCESTLEAAVLEVRYIHDLEPRYNRHGTTWRKYCYVKLTVERFPRLSIVHEPRRDGATYIGPVPSATGKQIVDAIHSAVPLRRCNEMPPREPRAAQCMPAQLGVATCPCSGAIGERDYADVADQVRRGVEDDASLLLDPLERRMRVLATEQRYEEAADVRDRADALARALLRQRRLDALRRSGRVLVETPNGVGAELVRGRFVRAWQAPGRDGQQRLPLAAMPEPPSVDGPLARHLADELACVAAWLDRHADRVRLIECDGELSSRWPPIPNFGWKPADSAGLPPEVRGVRRR